ncbi:MAG TPA: HPF/RaiA family ribosome-associated protein [Terracidiphilus sp.]|jgi:putative sigma-54 modulation protein|nr:HPF/RaiA family ribosome-associated protein [Terracidiphilus sp.]
MEVEFTARQARISKALRTYAEEGMERIGRILGKSAHASITFSTQRHEHIVELTLQGRAQKIAATGKANTPESALRQAMAHAEHQALRLRDRRIGSKRLPKEEKVMSAPPVSRPKSRVAPSVNGTEERAEQEAKNARASIAVHSFPAKPALVEPHILKNGEAIAIRPLTIEEAVKEAEFRDRDLLIFRTVAGDTFVLHRRRDGQMELVEIP